MSLEPVLPTVAGCEAAIAHYQRHLRALLYHLTNIQGSPDGPERDRQILAAKNAVQLLEFQLNSLKRDLNAAREREGNRPAT